MPYDNMYVIIPLIGRSMRSIQEKQIGKGEAFAKFNSEMDDSLSANASPLRQIHV